ncbi:MAG TPA: hypothetical protein DCQ06_06360 [Myxococcales bacterium]|nr:hypothetical protein [Myxococcales bacterium]HAN31205.1 hypothetical protein [Myxococcales bacterium]
MSTAGSVEPRLIKRYANRKMYDTVRSCYVTLQEVATMVQAGQDVQVIDNKTKDDLTEVTLAQALIDSKRKKRSGVSLHEIKRILTSGSDYIQQHISDPVSRVQRDAERTVGKWRDETERTVGKWRDEAERTVGKWRSEEFEGFEDGAQQGENSSMLPQSAAELSRSVDASVRQLFIKWAAAKDNVSDNSVLAARIETLEQRIALLEQRLIDAEGTTQPAETDAD